jgi:ribosomal protein S27E
MAVSNEREQIQHYELSEEPCQFPRNDAGTTKPEFLDVKCPSCGHQGMILDGRVVPHADCPQCEARYCVRRVYEPYKPPE